jgi:5-methyltetrahydropteroyltriglutamate--homocysteine methyltransferase
VAVSEHFFGLETLQQAPPNKGAQDAPAQGGLHLAHGNWKNTLGDQWRQYEQVFPALAKSSIQQVSLECYHSHVPPDLMRLLEGKDVMVGVIDVASDVEETPEQVAETIAMALQYVPKNRLFPCTNCGLAPMSREVALAKLQALAAGAALARQRLGVG